MALNALEKIANKQVTKTVTFQGQTLKISGKRATLGYLGVTPDADQQDSSFGAVDVAYTRKSHKRARWFGDTVGHNVPETTVNVSRYGLSDGSVTPGKPIAFKAVSDTGGDEKGRKVTGTVGLVGPFGLFVAYMEANRPTQSVYFASPRGKFLEQPTLSATEFAAID
jgi:hypothetical protein